MTRQQGAVDPYTRGDLELFMLGNDLGQWRLITMPINSGEAREIKDRANANEAEMILESKKLARKVKADLSRARRGAVDRPGSQGSKPKKSSSGRTAE
jgi:hypothetical protein